MTRRRTFPTKTAETSRPSAPEVPVFTKIAQTYSEERLAQESSKSDGQRPASSAASEQATTQKSAL